MRFSFFSALNPASKHSGISRLILTDLDRGEFQPSGELVDITVSEHIKNAFYSDFTLTESFGATFDIIAGNHHDYYNFGAKGVLDYLLFPLVARKLIADSYIDYKQHGIALDKSAAFAMSVPLEILRFTMATALTLLLAPVIAIIHVIKSMALKPEDHVDYVFNC